MAKQLFNEHLGTRKDFKELALNLFLDLSYIYAYREDDKAYNSLYERYPELADEDFNRIEAFLKKSKYPEDFSVETTAKRNWKNLLERLKKEDLLY